MLIVIAYEHKVSHLKAKGWEIDNILYWQKFFSNEETFSFFGDFDGEMNRNFDEQRNNVKLHEHYVGIKSFTFSKLRRMTA